MSLLTVGRGTTLPAFGYWIDQSLGWWGRPDSDEVIRDELARTFPKFDVDETTGEKIPRPQPTGFRRIKDADLPEDRRYRGAWRDRDGAIVHDMPKARALHLDRVRARRAKKLDELDRDWMRAMGQSKKADADAVEAKRQALRDLPTSLGVEKATTIEELKELWPAALG
jgi:hypothetical protein